MSTQFDGGVIRVGSLLQLEYFTVREFEGSPEGLLCLLVETTVLRQGYLVDS